MLSTADKTVITVSLVVSALSGYLSQFCMIGNGNRTEWSPMLSVIIRVVTKSDDRAAEVLSVYHEYDYRPDQMTRSLITINREKKNYDFREKKNSHVTKERENFHKKTNKGGLNCRSEIQEFMSLYTVSMVIETTVVIG